MCYPQIDPHLPEETAGNWGEMHQVEITIFNNLKIIKAQYVEEGRKGQGHDTVEKGVWVNKPRILWEKQSQGNMGYFEGNIFQMK